MSRLPVASRFSLVNELRDSFSSHEVLYGHARHRPSDDFDGLSKAGLMSDDVVPDSVNPLAAQMRGARGVSPGGKSDPSIAQATTENELDAAVPDPMLPDPTVPDPTVPDPLPNLPTDPQTPDTNSPQAISSIRFTGAHVSLDESDGLQNAAMSTAPGDQDDHDIDLNDLPSIFATRLTELGRGAPIEAALSGYNGVNGANIFEFDATGDVTLALVDQFGQALNGLDSGLKTVTGQSIYLYSDTVNPAIVFGMTASGEEVLAVYLEHTHQGVHGAMLWSVLYQPLFHSDATDPDDAVDLSGVLYASVTVGDGLPSFAGLPSGNHLFFMVANGQDGYVVTGKNPANQSAGQLFNRGDTVNISQADESPSLGTNNQMINPAGQALIITFVSNPNPDFTGAQLSQTEAKVESNIQFEGLRSVNSAYFMVNQTQPATRAATVEVAAWETNAGVGVNFIDPSNVNLPIAIERVRVLDGNMNVLEDSDGSIDAADITIVINAGVATITGVKAGYWVQYDTTDAHNRVSISNPPGPNGLTAAFDIGGFSTGMTETVVVEVGHLLKFEDDTPTVGMNATVYLDDDALPGGNPGGVGDRDPDQVATTGTLSHSFGADSAGASIAWLTDGAPLGFSYEASGNDLLVKQGMTTVMTLTLDPVTGAYAVVQNAAVMHEAGMDENDEAFRIGYRVTDGDGDYVDGVLEIIVNDDTPTVGMNATVYLDDDALPGGNPGGVGDRDPDQVATTGTLSHSFGADSAGASIAWLTDGAPLGFSYEASGNDLLVKQGMTTVMTLTLDPVTGAYAVVQNAAVMHFAGFNENDEFFDVGYRVTDGDGDYVDGILSIVVNDDTPVVNAVTGVTYLNSENPVPGAFGVFDYSIGADSRQEFSAINTDLLMFRLVGTVGVNSITNSSITWVSETNEAALFQLAFDYQPSEASPATSQATGYIDFNKTDGTYQFWLDQPLQGFSISTTSSALGFTGYQANSTTVSNNQPPVVVAQLTDTLFAQFSGVSEPGSGTGSNNLQAVGVDDDPNTFVEGEFFVQSSSWVSVSNIAAGVGGNTMQKGEVLNFTLYDSNPFGFLDQPATEFASSMFLKFDGIGASDDLVVVLGLIDPDTGSQTTRALIVESDAILKLGNTITPQYRIVLDNNDGAVIIESNDYNVPGESYLIYGAQVLTSVEGVSGLGIILNPLIGEAGASTQMRAFNNSDTDNDVIKISDIGVMTQSSATLNANLQIDLAVLDADFDPSPTQSIDVAILGSSLAPLDMTA